MLADVHIISGRGGALDGAVFNPARPSDVCVRGAGLAAGLFALVRSRRMLMRVAMLAPHRLPDWPTRRRRTASAVSVRAGLEETARS